MARSIAGQLAHEYCLNHPTAATKTIAAMLFRDHPKVFKDVEHARCRARYYRGEKGKHNKQTMKKSALVDNSQKRYNLPDSYAEEIEPYILEVTGKGMVISDVHIPYHDNDALTCALDYVTSKNYTDFCIVNGDLIDCYQLSRFCRDPRKRIFGAELEDSRQMLDVLNKIFKKVIFKLGNHELRYEHYLFTKAPELLGCDDFELHNLLRLEEKGIDFIKHNQLIYASQLTILHGHEYGRSMFSPVNPARGAYLRAHACTLSGHLHQSSEHNEPDIRRKLDSCWSTGCLCGLWPEYAALNKWNHGFATLEFDGDWFEVDNKRVIKQRVV